MLALKCKESVSSRGIRNPAGGGKLIEKNIIIYPLEGMINILKSSLLIKPFLFNSRVCN